MKEKISFIGAGSIAEAWLEGLLAKGFSPEAMMACEPRAERRKEMTERWGLRASDVNRDGAEFASVVVLATPPPLILPVLREIQPALRKGQVVISLGAGVALTALEAATAGTCPAVRVMPNIASLVGEGMNLVAFPAALPAADRHRVEALLDLLGRWLEVEDVQMEDWSALCAVGPTYLFPVIQGLYLAAVARGLPPAPALKAVGQVVGGTAHLSVHGNRTIAQLEKMIGLHTLEEDEARRLFSEAYDRAVDRLHDLRRKLAA
jgi:pyrroline-5-carboxylate reductase